MNISNMNYTVHNHYSPLGFHLTGAQYVLKIHQLKPHEDICCVFPYNRQHYSIYHQILYNLSFRVSDRNILSTIFSQS